MRNLLRATMQFIRLAIPWILRAIWVTIQMCLTALSSWIVGIPESSHRIATTWTNSAIQAGFPTAYVNQLYGVLQTIALTIIFASWVVFAVISALIMAFIF